jgi:membrane protein insertase Oxa1/YidC/SpoIIIJ
MMLIQIPVFIGLYYVVRKISANQIPTDWVYSFFSGFGSHFVGPNVLGDGSIKTHFLGMDLLATKNIILTVLAAIFTYLQTKFTTLAKPDTPTIPGQKTPDMGKMMGFMNIFLVFMIASFVYTMNAAIGLYLVTTTLFSVVQYGWQYRAILKAKWTEWTSKGKK